MDELDDPWYEIIKYWTTNQNYFSVIELMRNDAIGLGLRPIEMTKSIMLRVDTILHELNFERCGDGIYRYRNRAYAG